jgi:translation initiation factor IF-1
MAKQENILTCEGKVIAAPSHTLYKVALTDGREMLCYCAGRVRRNHIRILVGDRVTVVVSAYDLTQGRIVYRH